MEKIKKEYEKSFGMVKVSFHLQFQLKLSYFCEDNSGDPPEKLETTLDCLLVIFIKSDNKKPNRAEPLGQDGHIWV